MPLTPVEVETLKRELIAVMPTVGDPVLFTHHDFLAVSQGEQLRRLGELVPEGSSATAGLRAIARLRTEDEHARILRRTLLRLLAHAERVVASPSEMATGGARPLVATFPLQS